MNAKKEQDRSTVTLALILIGLGMIMVLRKLGIVYDFSGVWSAPFHGLLQRLEMLVFSWPMVFVIVGLLLYKAGRSFGLVMLVIGLFFLFPKLLLLTGVSMSILVPLMLIVLGVLIIKRAI